jgi:hypothetical protein
LALLTGNQRLGDISKTCGTCLNSIPSWTETFLEGGPEILSQDSASVSYGKRIFWGELPVIFFARRSCSMRYWNITDPEDVAAKKGEILS